MPVETKKCGWRWMALESHVLILPLPTLQGLLSNALSPLACPCLQTPSQSILFNPQFKCTSARKTVSICSLIGHLWKAFHVHCGSSTEILGVPWRGAGVPYSAQKMCHRTADAEGKFSPIQCSSIVCSLLSLPPHEFSFSFCTFSYKLNRSFPFSVPPTKATSAVPQNVPLLLGFIPLPMGSHAEHQELLSYFSSLPPALF